MRGDDLQQSYMFSYVSAEDRVPQDHPLRSIKKIVDEVLKSLSPQFSRMYSREGRPSIAPEKLLKALLLQALYSIRSERMLIEQLDYNLLFRWFVGLSMDDAVWAPTTFTKNRKRLLDAEVAEQFFRAVVDYADQQGFLSNEHFTVDGTLIQGWAGQKSFLPKKADSQDADSDQDEPGPDDVNLDGSGSGRNAEVNFRGQKRSNATHESTTDRQTRLCRKGRGKEAKLCYQGHVLMENRNGLVVQAKMTIASGTAERDVALELIERLPGTRRRTVGADKGYDTTDFVEALRRAKVTPHVAAKDKNSAIDGRTTRHQSYKISQVIRKRVEESFG
jgi:transposase